MQKNLLTFIRDSFKPGIVKPLPMAVKCKAPVLAVCGLILWAGNLSAQTPTPADPAATPPPLESPTPPSGNEALPANVQLSTGTGAKKDAAPAAPATPSGSTLHPGGAKFLGAMSCSSSLCHGSGSDGERNAYTVWKAKDPHRASFAVLAGTQSARIAQGLQLASAAGSTRCTECHAPLATVAEERLAHGLDVRTEGVSCESCHGPSSNWVRSHTRTDLTHAQNVQTGVRDLRNLYVRANNCVACHQVIEPDVLAAGHPPLIFELDAQSVAEPRHWLDKGDFFGPQAWLTGQAAALRETSWSLSQQTDPKPEVREQWRALVWLLHKATDAYGHGVPTFDAPDADTFSPGNVSRAQSVADDLARAAAHSEWSGASTRRTLNALADADKDFVPVAGGEPALALQNRAQRLALALSRLVAPFQVKEPGKWVGTSKELDKLFILADARANFDGAAFSNQLKTFRATLGGDE